MSHLGVAVLGTAVLHPPNRWIGKGTQPRLCSHGSLRRTQSSHVHKPIRRWEPVTAQMRGVAAQTGASPADVRVGLGAGATKWVPAQMRETAYLGVASLGVAVLGGAVGLKSNTPMWQSPETLKARSRPICGSYAAAGAASVVRAQMVHCLVSR